MSDTPMVTRAELDAMTLSRDLLERDNRLAHAELDVYRRAFAGMWIAPDADDVLCVWMWWRGQPVVVIGLDELQIGLADGLAAVLPTKAPDQEAAS